MKGAARRWAMALLLLALAAAQGSPLALRSAADIAAFVVPQRGVQFTNSQQVARDSRWEAWSGDASPADLSLSFKLELCPVSHSNASGENCFTAKERFHPSTWTPGIAFFPCPTVRCTVDNKYAGMVTVSLPGSEELLASTTGTFLCHSPIRGIDPYYSSPTSRPRAQSEIGHLRQADAQPSVPSETSNVVELNSAVTRVDGFRSFGPKSSGHVVSKLGDINLDGYDDFIVGQEFRTSSSALAYVVFGQAAILWDNYLAELNSTQGFPIYSSGSMPSIEVSNVGDVNGDGYADFSVGTVSSSDNASSMVYVIFGSRTMYSVNLTALSPTQGATITYNGPACSFGSTMMGLSDVNGDGLDDFVIGASAYEEYTGAAFVIYGKTAFESLAINATSGIASGDGFQLVGEFPGDEFGASLGQPGDVDSDGFHDILVGARNWSARVGRAYLLFGSAETNTTHISMLTLGSRGFTLTGNVDGDSSAWSVSGVGDVNGDGVSDFAVGSPNARLSTGYATVIYGQASRSAFPQNIALDHVGTLGFRLFGDYSLASFGYAVTGTGDMDGDGIDDMAISAPFAHFQRGIVYVIFGAAVQNRHDISMIALYADAGVSYLGTASGIQGARLGQSLAGLGDINRDGMNDLACGSPGVSSSTVILGNPGGLASTDLTDWTTTNVAFAGAHTSSYAGYTLNAAGDVDLDQYDDIIVGSLISSPLGREGAGMAYVIYGGSQVANANLLAITPSKGSIFYGPTAGAVCSRGLASGDINGDAVNDLLVSCSGNGVAYALLSSGVKYPAVTDLADWEDAWGLKIVGSAADFCGFSLVASDYNGDGIADILLGCYKADPNGRSDAGVVYIIWGGSNASVITLSGFSPAMGVQIFGASAGDQLGCCKLQEAGDVNGDGFDDILVGSPGYQDRRGAAYVIYGGKSLPAIIDLQDLDPMKSSLLGIVLTGFQPNDQVGYACSGAGDFNGDGKADLLIGALGTAVPGQDYVGAAYVVYGSAAPCNVDFGNFHRSQGFAMYGSSYGDRAGGAVSSVGDMNNDGYSDVIIGANGYDADRGAAYVVYGQAGTYASNLVLSGIDADRGLVILGAGYGDRTAFAVARAGDVDNNGVQDYLVGAYSAHGERGVAYLFKSLPAPTVHPTSFPTSRPSAAPREPETKPSVFEEYENVILLTAIPAIALSVPVYFSQRICFRVLGTWGRGGATVADDQRGWHKRLAYATCKRMFLNSYLEFVEAKQRKHEMDQEQLLAGENRDELGCVESSAETGVELATMSQGVEETTSPLFLDTKAHSSDERHGSREAHGASVDSAAPRTRSRGSSGDAGNIEEWLGRQTVAAAAATVNAASATGRPPTIVRAVFDIKYDNPFVDAVMHSPASGWRAPTQQSLGRRAITAATASTEGAQPCTSHSLVTVQAAVDHVSADWTASRLASGVHAALEAIPLGLYLYWQLRTTAPIANADSCAWQPDEEVAAVAVVVLLAFLHLAALLVKVAPLCRGAVAGSTTPSTALTVALATASSVSFTVRLTMQLLPGLFITSPAWVRLLPALLPTAAQLACHLNWPRQLSDCSLGARAGASIRVGGEFCLQALLLLDCGDRAGLRCLCGAALLWRASALLRCRGVR